MEPFKSVLFAYFSVCGPVSHVPHSRHHFLSVGQRSAVHFSCLTVCVTMWLCVSARPLVCLTACAGASAPCADPPTHTHTEVLQGFHTTLHRMREKPEWKPAAIEQRIIMWWRFHSLLYRNRAFFSLFPFGTFGRNPSHPVCFPVFPCSPLRPHGSCLSLLLCHCIVNTLWLCY